MKNITIIGGGACGAAAFIAFSMQLVAHKMQERVSVTLIERREKIGYGMAFGTPQQSHLLNTPASLMGIYDHEPEDFSNWLTKKQQCTRNPADSQENLKNTHTSRLLYGDYVAEQLQEQIAKARGHGLLVHVLHDEVIAVDKKKDKFILKLNTSASRPADFVLLALGTPKPSTYKKFANIPAYLDFPWPSLRMEKRINTQDHVGILGSSLSAIDTVMTLMDNGHQGKISLFSNDGLLPKVQPRTNTTVERKYLNLENVHRHFRKNMHFPKLETLFYLFQKDAERLAGKKIDWPAQHRKGKDAHQLLQQDIKAAQTGSDIFLNLAYSLRYESGTLWRWLSLEEKKRFKNGLQNYWIVNRHAMPLRNALRLEKLFKTGKLKIHADIGEVFYQEDEQQFKVQRLKANPVKVDKLINATGSAPALEEMDNRLIKNLVKNEYLAPYPLGGTWINPETMEVQSPKMIKNLYAVGHLVNGVLLDINAVWFNVKTISLLVDGIVCKLQADERFS